MNFNRITAKTLLCIIGCQMFFSYNFSYSLSTQDILSQVFSLDAQNIDNDYNSANDPLTGSTITNAIDNFGSHTGFQNNIGQQPLFEIDAINDMYPGIKFDGSNDLLNIHDHIDISVAPSYTKKSYSIVLKTGTDISSLQTIYDEGTKEKGFNFQIKNSNLYAGAYNSIDWATGDEYKIIDFGTIEAEKEYIIIFVYDSTLNEVRGYLNGILQGTLIDSGSQTTHGACIFTAYFDCVMYTEEGTIAVGATKNDSIDLSDTTQISGFETNFFNGHIGEIDSWNQALTASQASEINTFLMIKWGFDSTPPVLDADTGSGAIIPTETLDLNYTYSDTHTGALGIDISSINLELYKWDSGAFGTGNIITNHRNDSYTNETLSGAVYKLDNLTLGKYRLLYEISDFGGNTQSNEIVFYKDAPELIVGSGSIDIGTLMDGIDVFSPEINVTVKTIGAPYELTMNIDEQLNYGLAYINTWDGTDGFGYDQEIFSNTISLVGSEQYIGSGSINLNTDGILNEYVYKIKFGSNINSDQVAGDYEGKVSFGIDFQFNK